MLVIVLALEHVGVGVGVGRRGEHQRVVAERVAVVVGRAPAEVGLGARRDAERGGEVGHGPGVDMLVVNVCCAE